MNEAGVEEVAPQFRIDGRLISAQRYGNGHINQTFLGRYATPAGEQRYIHQRINDRIFSNVRALMENIARVTRHAPALLAPLVPTVEGRDVCQARDGSWWRTYTFIEGARSYETVDGPDRAYQAAKAFGRFVDALADLGGLRLHETIPAFHDTGRRLNALRDAVAYDPLGRAREVRSEIAYCLRNADLADGLVALQRAGIAQERVTHNDTKLNNVLIDDATGEGVCVIDLDSVMPGLALYDVGDLIRTATARAAEDESDLSAVEAEPELFAAVACGFIEGARASLSAAERDHLVTAGRVITFECGVRFLTDHLLGDGYFRIHRAAQNLDRARVQFALVDSLARREADLQRTVK